MLANEAGNGHEKWATQIPIWSGIRGPRSDGRCDIDIGYSVKEGCFSLCELKIGSDDPLYAIVELVTYVLGYLIARKLAAFLPPEKVQKIRDNSQQLIDAFSVDWLVVAPAEYYEKPTSVKGAPNVSLRTSELEQVRQIAEKCIIRTSAAFGFEKLRMTLTLRYLTCKKPPQAFADLAARERWIREVKGTSTLRALILQAPIFGG